jgi:hypothetical protein
MRTANLLCPCAERAPGCRGDPPQRATPTASANPAAAAAAPRARTLCRPVLPMAAGPVATGPWAHTPQRGLGGVDTFHPREQRANRIGELGGRRMHTIVGARSAAGRPWRSSWSSQRWGLARRRARAAARARTPRPPRDPPSSERASATSCAPAMPPRKRADDRRQGGSIFTVERACGAVCPGCTACSCCFEATRHQTSRGRGRCPARVLCACWCLPMACL